MDTLLKKRQAFLDKTCLVADHVQHYIDRINTHKHLNAFVATYFDEALEKAARLDTKITNGEPVGKLAGIVVAIKDNISYKGHSLTCGSHVLNKHLALYHAKVIENLLSEDAIIIGHTNMDEFAMGSSNETSYYGNVRNPVDTERVPGGSSGGSAAVIAAQLADISLGSDTGGSIRQPAAFTGTVGLKPTYGLVSRYGLVAFGSSLDQIGPFGHSVADVAHVLNVIISSDENDSTSIQRTETDYTQFLGRDIKGMKIGIAKEFFGTGLNPEINDKIEQLKKQLAEKGAEFVDVSLPHIKYSIAVYYIIATAEASANLARYDGVRYGLRSESEGGLDNMYSATREEGFGEEVKRRIMLGTFVLSHGYFDAYYRKAQKVRRKIKMDFDAAFETCDVLLTPSTPTTAFKFGEFSDDPLAMYLADIYTAPANLAGIPGISVPFGTDENKLPIGVQILANQFEESKLIQLADTIEKLEK